MNIYGRFNAAVGSVALNAALALVLAQGAVAAAEVPAPARSGSAQAAHISAYSGAKQLLAHQRCASGLRTRTIIAVVLGLIV
jgi:hypothetical protein